MSSALRAGPRVHTSCTMPPPSAVDPCGPSLLPCCCSVAMLLQCCRVVAVLPCCCSVAVLLQCCRVVAVLLPCCCRVVAVLLSCCCRVVVLLQCFQIFSEVSALLYLLVCVCVCVCVCVLYVRECITTYVGSTYVGHSEKVTI